MSDVNMPKLSDTMEEGTIANWKKKSGDPVKKGEVLAEVESDKATFDLEADADGTLNIVVEAGQAVPVGAQIAQIAKEGDVAAPSKQTPKAEATPEKPVTDAKTKVKATDAEGSGGTEQPQGVKAAAEEPTTGPTEKVSTPASEPAETDSERIKASPIALRLAAEMGLDIRTLTGSGPEGRIVKEDVLAAAKQQRPSSSSRGSEQRPSRSRGGPDVEHEEISRMQSIVARRMVLSKTTVPHFYVSTEVRMDEAVKVQKQVRASVEGAEKVTISDLVMRACAIAIRKYPEVNASWAEDHIEVKKRINIGFAVAPPKGLVVPVLKDVDEKDLVQISIETRQLIERARAGKPSPQDLEGGTFSVSNLGMFGVSEFAAVVNPPEAAIVAVGTIRDVPVVEEGRVVPGKTMKLTISVDHRVLYGANAAQFLAEVRRLLENPVSLVLPPDMV